MIRYTLKCAVEHGFDSWFQSAEAFASLVAGGMVSCPVCGSTSVSKALMAPAVAHAPPADGTASTQSPLSTPQNDHERALAALRRHVEQNSDYVGVNFVSEVRRIHQGEAPERAIHGEAAPQEAIKLLEDGIAVAPLPFLPGRKTN